MTNQNQSLKVGRGDTTTKKILEQWTSNENERFASITGEIIRLL